MAKAKLKMLARQLRREGKSIKEIVKITNAAQSSVSLWCRDIELSREQIEELERRTHDPYYGRRLEYMLSQKKNKEIKIEKIMTTALKEVGKLTTRELFLIGIALYWAEGFKKDSQAGFASSDPHMIKLFLCWLKKCFQYSVSDLSFRVTINSSHEYRLSDIQQYWVKQIGDSNAHFQKPFFQKTKWQKVYEHPENYFGVFRIRVRKSTDFLRRINGFIEGFKKYAG